MGWSGISGLMLLAAAQAAAPAAPAPRVAPPDRRAQFTGGAAPVVFDNKCRNFTAYQMHPRPDGDPELRVYGGLDTPFIPPAFGFTDEFRRLYYSAYSDPAVLERLEREQASLPTPYLYELSRRLAAVSAEKALGYYMLARVRMTYDAKRCADPMAIEAVSGWDRLMARDVRFALIGSTPALRKAAVDFALAREAAMPADSRPWWVCYSGMEAYGLAMDKKPVPLKLKPAKDWPKLRSEARNALKALLTAPSAP